MYKKINWSFIKTFRGVVDVIIVWNEGCNFTTLAKIHLIREKCVGRFTVDLPDQGRNKI